MKAATRKPNPKRLLQVRRKFLAVLQLRRKFLADEEAKQVTTESKIKPAPSDIVPGTRMTYQRLAMEDLKIAAFHEAAHFVIANHFKPQLVETEIWEKEEGPTLKTKGVAGKTGCLAMPGAATFRYAVIAWAGCLAETLCFQPVEEWEQEDLLWLWDDWEDLGLSPRDKSEVEAHPMRWRAFKTAAAILFKRRFELEKVAQYLEKNGYLTAAKGKYKL
jgi:hypothetical protein